MKAQREERLALRIRRLTAMLATNKLGARRRRKYLRTLKRCYEHVEELKREKEGR